MAPSAYVWLLLGALYFFVPLVATLLFSLKSNTTGKCCTLANYGTILHDPAFWQNLKVSFILALETIAISLVLLVPTVYWVHLKVPRLRPADKEQALLPQLARRLEQLEMRLKIMEEEQRGGLDLSKFYQPPPEQP